VPGGDVVDMYQGQGWPNQSEHSRLICRTFFSKNINSITFVHIPKNPFWFNAGYGIVMGAVWVLMSGQVIRIVTETFAPHYCDARIQYRFIFHVGGSYFLNLMPRGCVYLLGLNRCVLNHDAHVLAVSDYLFPHANKKRFIESLQKLWWQMDWSRSNITGRCSVAKRMKIKRIALANIVNDQTLCTQLTRLLHRAEWSKAFFLG